MSEAQEVTDLILGRRNDAAQTAVGSLGDDPDQAARALKLSTMTGVPAAAIEPNVEEFENDQKAAITSHILKNNTHIADYVNSHLLAAKVSNDDYGQLDSVSQKLKQFGGASVIHETMKGFAEGYGERQFGEWLYKRPQDIEFAQNNPLAAAALSVLGLPIELPAKIISGGISAIKAGSEEAAIQLGMDPSRAGRMSRDLAAMAELMVQQPGLLPHGGAEQVREQVAKKYLENVKSYLDAGLEPPLGVHPLFDQLKIEQNKLDLRNYDEAMKESQQSLTKERSPELFAQFVRQHTDQRIGISAEAIEKMYGEKEPTAGDGKLGFIPNIEEQFRVARETGGDIEVPLADWLAHVDPALAKELHDDVRLRRGGVTANEAKELGERETALAQTEEVPPAVETVKAPTESAVAATRDAADLRPILERPNLDEVFNRYRGEFEQHGPELKVFVPEGEWTPIERQAVDSAVAELERILPGRQYKTVPGRAVVLQEREVRGAYQPYKDRLPTIAFLANPETAVQTARHEAIHYLRRQGFFTPQEWSDLKTAAHYNNWLEKHHVAERWPELAKAKDAATMIEEAIAEEFVDWRKAKERRTVAGKIFAKLNDLSQQVLEAIKKATGLGDKAYDVFSRIESGEIGSRTGTKPIDPRAFAGQEFEAGQQQLFAKANAIGMTVDQFKRYMKLIDKRNAEDAAWAEKKALEQTKREQTTEWKANRSRVRDEVAHDVEARPDIATATFLQDYGLKIDRDALTPEQRDVLPRSLQEKGGLPPDELAAQFGFHSGDAMVERLAMLDQARGKGGFREYLDKVINAETDQRMLREYGDLNENILAEAKDHVLSETQMDLLHEETLALGMKIGEAPLDKATLKATFQQAFNKLRTSVIDTDKFLAEAGRAGKAAEMALLKEDPTEAFRQKQRQYFAILGANEAKKLDKDMQRFEKNAKRFSKREVAGVAPEYTNFVHDILMRVGQPVRRSVQDLADAIRKDSYTSLENFVSEKSQGLRDLHVPEFLLDPSFRKTIPELTAEEFRQVNDAVKALAFNGRDELKIEKAGEKVDIENVIGEMKEKLASLDLTYERRLGPNRGTKAALETGKSWWWSGITVESMLNRVDRDNPRGIFNQTIVRPFAEASNYKDKLIRDFQAKMSEVPKVADLDKKIDNDLWLEPFSKQPLAMRRRNVLGILQNIGNQGNLKKLAGGYGLEPAQVIQWVMERTTKEDWDRAQKIGNIFEEVYQLADRMSHNVSGVGIQKIPLSPIDTPFGSYRGWYNPIKYDSVRPGESKKLIGQSVEQEGFYRATTPQGYTEARTGYVAPIELDLDVVPQRMKQMVHDIAMRPAVLQLSKLFYNRAFKDAMIEHLGEHRAESMIPFLRDIANSPNFLSLEQSYANQAIETLRQNTISTLIGFNPGTVMKHGTTAWVNSFTEVGAKDFLREMTTLLRDDGQGKSNWRLAMEKSEELQRRMKNFQELVAGHGSEINLRGAQSKYGSFREFLMQAGATPVSLSDLLSAVPTWLAKYKDEIAQGANEGDAKFLADRAVRRAHGSSVLSNKPAIMRTNPLGAMFSSLYGFFSHMQQKQYELAWKARDMIKGNDKDVTYNPKLDLTKGLVSYIIIPAIVEELVTPYTNAEKDSWGVKAAKTLGLGISSSFIGIRDAVRAVVNQRDPQAGMTGASLKALTDLPRDLGSKQPMSKERAANILRHTFTLTGVLTGLVNQQEGALAQYLLRYNQGVEKPKGPWDVAVGMRYGKTDKHSRTFDEWRKHTFGGH
jgi:hypothetical protein